MKRINIKICVAFLILQFAQPAWADEAAPAAKSAGPIFGYLDPKNDTFTPAVQPTPAAPAATTIYRKGILVITGTVAMAPSMPSTSTFTATVQATISDATYTTSVSTTGSVIRSGNTGKFTFRLPYFFTFASASDTVSISLNMYSLTGETSVSLTQTIPLPANNATTAVNIRERV